MKKYLLSAVATLGILGFTSCSKTPQISITFNGFTSDTVVIAHCSVANFAKLRNDSDPRITYDTIKVDNSTLALTPADSTSLYLIIPWENPGHNLKIIVSPTDRLSIEATCNDGIVSYAAEGSPNANAINDYYMALGDITAQITTARKKGDDEVLDSLYDIRRERTTAWISSHLDNPMIAIRFAAMAPDSIVKYYGLVSQQMKDSEIGPKLEQAYRRANKMLRIEKARENIKEGAEAPDFTLRDAEGKDVTLSSLRGKWVVLDFWGTWCGWCIKGIPDMKAAYAKSAGKCEFVSIACGDEHAKWLEALARYDMPWIQLYNPKDLDAELDITTSYAIQGFPTKMIISPDGLISHITEGEQPDFYEALNKLVK